jgi:hypothetical protein
VEVHLHGPFGDGQPLGDRLVAQPLGHHLHHLDFARGQRFAVRVCGRFAIDRGADRAREGLALDPLPTAVDGPHAVEQHLG